MVAGALVPPQCAGTSARSGYLGLRLQDHTECTIGAFDQFIDGLADLSPWQPMRDQWIDTQLAKGDCPQTLLQISSG